WFGSRGKRRRRFGVAADGDHVRQFFLGLDVGGPAFGGDFFDDLRVFFDRLRRRLVVGDLVDVAVFGLGHDLVGSLLRSLCLALHFCFFLTRGSGRAGRGGARHRRGRLLLAKGVDQGRVVFAATAAAADDDPEGDRGREQGEEGDRSGPARAAGLRW